MRRRLIEAAVAVVSLAAVGYLIAERSGILRDLDRARQKRMISNLRQIGEPLMTAATDAAGARPCEILDATGHLDVASLPVATVADFPGPPDVAAALLAMEDPWGHPYDIRYRPGTADCLASVVIRARGADGEFDTDVYEPGAIDRDDAGADVVWADGYFFRWPD